MKLALGIGLSLEGAPQETAGAQTSPPPPTSITADSTAVTVDSTTITADHT